MLKFLKNFLKPENNNGEGEKVSKVLYITANPNTFGGSHSLAIGDAFITAYSEANPKDEIIKFDVYNEYVPIIDTDVLGAWGQLGAGAAFDSLTESQQKKIGRMNEILEQFLSADKYIFVTPLWNLSIPALAKAYIDNIVIAGRTFKYTENGPVGLLSGKKGVHIQARGGFYSEGPAAEFELGDKYVKTIFGFLGVTDFQSIISEGAAYVPDQAAAILDGAKAKAVEAAKTF